MVVVLIVEDQEVEQLQILVRAVVQVLQVKEMPEVMLPEVVSLEHQHPEEEKEEQDQFTPIWRSDVDMWDVNDDWRPKGKKSWGFPIILDDFPRRSAKHFADRPPLYENNGSSPRSSQEDIDDRSHLIQAF